MNLRPHCKLTQEEQDKLINDFLTEHEELMKDLQKLEQLEDAQRKKIDKES